MIRTAVVGGLTAALLTGCVSEGTCSGAGAGSASCAAGVEFDGELYVAWSDRLPVERGELLGEAAYPPCDDGGGCGDAADPTGTPTQVWTMRGVDPDLVVVGRSEGLGRWVVYGSADADPKDYFRLVHGAWQLREPPRGHESDT